MPIQLFKCGGNAPQLSTCTLSFYIPTLGTARINNPSLKVECLLTLAIWSYGHEAEEYIFSELTVSFKSQGKFFNLLYFEYPGAKSATTYYRLYYSGYRLHPNTFHNTINKNVNHSNDTIDNLNQSSFHKPARQCQGHLRTESFPALLTFCTAV